MKRTDQETRDRLLRDYRTALDAMQAGDHEDALGLLLACYQDADESRPVRDSFIVGALADLAAGYPPARTEVLKLREMMAAALVNHGLGSNDWLNAVLAIDERFGLGGRSHQLALDMDRVHGPQARSSLPLARVFLDAGDVARARAHLGDAREHVDVQVAALNRISARTPQPSMDDAMGAASWYQRTLDLIVSVVRANGELDLAEELARTALQGIAHRAWRAVIEREIATPGAAYAQWQREAEPEAGQPGSAPAQ